MPVVNHSVGFCTEIMASLKKKKKKGRGERKVVAIGLEMSRAQKPNLPLHTSRQLHVLSNQHRFRQRNYLICM